MLSVFDLHSLLNEKNIPHALMVATNESLVTCVRNHFANMAAFDSGFQGREFSHLLFVDSDSVFDATDILRMLEANKPIVALPFSVKQIRWELVGQAARLGLPDNLLEYIAGDPNINTCKLSFDGAAQPVDQIGTGVMLIDTKVPHTVFATWPDRKYRLYPSEIGNVSPYEGETRDFGCEFFRTGISPKTGFYLSEDFMFIDDARSLGFDTYVLADAITSHIGRFEYKQNLGLLASLGLNVRDILKQPQESNSAATEAASIKTC